MGLQLHVKVCWILMIQLYGGVDAVPSIAFTSISLDPVNSNNYLEAGTGTWTALGTLTATDAEAALYGSFDLSVSNGSLCSIDVTTCPPATLPTGDQICYCESRNSDVRNFKAIVLAVTQNTQATDLKGQYSRNDGSAQQQTISSLSFPSIVDAVTVTSEVSGNNVTLTSGSNNVTYSGATLNTDIKICAANVLNGVFQFNSATVTLTNTCVEQSVNASSPVAFTYTETGGLARTDTFTITLQDAPSDEDNDRSNIGGIVGGVCGGFGGVLFGGMMGAALWWNRKKTKSCGSNLA